MTPEKIKKLSDSELRIKVAELLGWRDFGWTTVPGCEPALFALPQHDTPGGPWPFGDYEVPNYPADLNACHEMEESLTDIEFCKYVQTLCGHTKPKVRIEWSGPDAGRACCAKARQRCEAFVAVLDKETK